MPNRLLVRVASSDPLETLGRGKLAWAARDSTADLIPRGRTADSPEGTLHLMLRPSAPRSGARRTA